MLTSALAVNGAGRSSDVGCVVIGLCDGLVCLLLGNSEVDRCFYFRFLFNRPHSSGSKFGRVIEGKLFGNLVFCSSINLHVYS